MVIKSVDWSVGCIEVELEAIQLTSCLAGSVWCQMIVPVVDVLAGSIFKSYYKSIMDYGSQLAGKKKIGWSILFNNYLIKITISKGFMH